MRPAALCAVCPDTYKPPLLSFGVMNDHRPRGRVSDRLAAGQGSASLSRYLLGAVNHWFGCFVALGHLEGVAREKIFYQTQTAGCHSFDTLSTSGRYAAGSMVRLLYPKR